MRSSRRNAIAFYLTISPWLVGFLAFTLLPMAIALYLGFTRWDLFNATVGPASTTMPGWRAIPSSCRR